MGKKPTFKCWNCKSESGYLSRAKEQDEFYGLVSFGDYDETRTYYCQRCKRANKIKLKESEWVKIENQMKL